MDHAELKLFLHLSRSLHFANTSRECHVSPSALSRTIQRLESELGHRLFERDRRSVRLTHEGERVQSFAAESLARYATLEQELRARQDVLTGTISIFASVTACQTFLPSLLNRFRELHPEIHIRLETGYAARALDVLDRGDVDLTVAALPERVPSHLATRVVASTALDVVAPAAPCEVSRRVDQPPIDWATLPVVLPAFGLARKAVDRWFSRKRCSPTVYSEVTGNEAILSLVSLGCGVGVVPRLVWEKSPLAGEVRRLEVSPDLGEFRIGVCVRKRALEEPLVAACWQAMAED